MIDRIVVPRQWQSQDAAGSSLNTLISAVHCILWTVANTDRNELTERKNRSSRSTQDFLESSGEAADDSPNASTTAAFQLLSDGLGTVQR